MHPYDPDSPHERLKALLHNNPFLDDGWGDRGWGIFRVLPRRSIEALRNRATRLEAKRRQPPRTPDYPPQLTPNDAAAMAQLKAQIAALQAQLERFYCRQAEREIVELQDVLASPTALRVLAEAFDALLEQKEREERARKEQQKQWFQDTINEIRNGGMHPLDVLDLPANATSEQIKQRYRERVKQLHPDTNAGDMSGSELLRQVTEAMDQLRAEGRVQ